MILVVKMKSEDAIQLVGKILSRLSCLDREQIKYRYGLYLDQKEITTEQFRDTFCTYTRLGESIRDDRLREYLEEEFKEFNEWKEEYDEKQKEAQSNRKYC